MKLETCLVVTWLLNSQGMKNSKSTESFCLRILTIYTNDWSTYILTSSLLSCFFFSERFLSMCKPRTTFYLFEGLAHLDGDFMDVGQHTYGAAWGWWIQFSSVPWDQKFSCRWNLSFFKAIPLKRTPFFPPYNQLLIQPVLLVPECYFA